MRTILVAFIVLLSLNACSEKTDFSTPAQSSIDEYTAKLKECQDKNQAAGSTSQSPPPVPVISPTNSLFDINKNDYVQGNAQAKVVVVEYFSPTCPHCAYYHQKIFPEIKKKYIDTNKIAYVTREFIGNKQDLDAALLARCPGTADDFFKFINVLLDRQDSWITNNKYRDVLTNIGQLGGVSPESYAKCLNDDALGAILIANTQSIAKFPKFVGTPAFFINGVYFTSPYTVDALANSIELALKKSAETK